MANLSNINNKFIVTDGGQTLVNQTIAGFNPDADDLIVGNLSGNTGITIASGPNVGNYGSIYFADGAGSSTPSKAGYIRYEQNTSKMTIGINAVEKVAIDLNGNVKIGNSTTGTPAVNADDLVIDKGASESGITLMSTAAASIRFGDAANTSIGSIEYNHNSDYMRMIVNNAERMRIDSSGNIGINGTSNFGSSNKAIQLINGVYSGAFQIDSVGNIGLAQNAYQDGAWKYYQTNEAAILNLEDGQFKFFNAASGTADTGITFTERMRIDSSGRVGIGTNNPQAALQINHTGGNNGIRIISPNNVNGFLQFGDSDDDNVGRIVYGHSSDSMQFVTNDAERMRIASNGDVGFNATSNLNLSNFQISTGSGLGENVSVFIANTSGVPYVNSATTTQLGLGFLSGTANYVATGQILGNLQFYGQANDAGYGGASIKALVTTGGNVNRSSHAVDMVFSTMAAGSVGDVERMRITSAGYVAIPNDAGSYAGAASLIVTKKSSVPYVQYQYSGTNTSFRLEMDEYVTAGNVRQYFTQTNGGVGYGFSMTFNTGSVIFGDLEVASATQNSGSAFKKDSKARMTLCQGSNSTALTDLQEYFNPNGAVGKIQTSGSATLFTTSSDYRLKEDLKSFSGLEMVSKIPVYDFKWKISDERSYGVMAHELQEVLPQAVGGDKDYEKDYVVKKAEYDDNHNLIKEAEYGKRPSYQTVDYSKIVPLLVKSIQELKAEIELLKSK